MENNELNSDINNNGGNKKILNIAISFLVVVIIFLTIILIGNDKNKIDTNITTTGTGNTITSGTGEIVSEEVLLIYKNDPLIFSEETLSGFVSVGKNFSQKIIPVLSNDDRVKDIVKAAGKNMYYPMFVFKQNSPNIKYNNIPKNNLYVDDKNKLFAIDEPILLNLPKIIIPRTEEINSLITKYSLDGENVSKNNESFILAIEDPLCPFCAQTYLDKTTQQALGNSPVKYLYYPLPITGHENSNKLIGLLRSNNNDKALLETIFKNQKSLIGTGVVINDKIKSLLKESGSKLKIKDGKKLEYSDTEIEEIKNLLLKLGVLGTPTYFIVNKDEIILVGNLNMVQPVLKK